MLLQCMAVDLRGWEILILGFVYRGRLGVCSCGLRSWKILTLGLLIGANWELS